MADAFCLPQTPDSLLNEYRFVCGDLPAGCRLAHEPIFYNEYEHRLLQARTGWLSFYITNLSATEAFAAAHFYLEHGVARSHPRSPFGGIDVSPELDDGVLPEFVAFIENELQTRNVSRIILKHPPSFYFPDHLPVLESVLLSAGFQCATAELSSVLFVDDRLPHTQQLKKLRKAARAGLRFVQHAFSDAAMIYDFVSGCRAAKGYSFSMTRDQFLVSFEKFPHRYLLFSVYDGQRMVAAAITVRVRSDVLYDFAHDHLSEYDALSPVVFMVDNICEFCRLQAIPLLDLGTSHADGRINFGLLTFKRRLGAKTFSKLTFEKVLTR